MNTADSETIKFNVKESQLEEDEPNFLPNSRNMVEFIDGDALIRYIGLEN